jgi:hypothetical protein
MTDDISPEDFAEMMGRDGQILPPIPRAHQRRVY